MSTHSSSDPNPHSDPIPIGPTSNQRSRSRSFSEGSDSDSVPPLSPSESPASATSATIQTPFSSSTRIPLSPVSPSSPILSYFYGSPTKSPFNRMSVPTFEDEDSREPPPTSAGFHRRHMSNSWIPVRFGPQQPPPNNSATDSQQNRGAGVLRRLSISSSLTSKPTLSVQPRSATPPKQDGGTRPGHHSPRGSGQLRKAATLSAGTVSANEKPRPPSPMGERMLKGHYDGF
ncbi:hypothetical protein K439DRAFT_1621828 [Ramaria rubella]|nr:hypothetical protein K439DRAFT_1621828 [Ramaria rubella]